MVGAARRDQGIGLVGCKMMHWPDTGRIWSTGGFVSGWRQRYAGFGEIDRGQYARSAPRTFISGAVMLIPRTTLERVGLLPEEYFFGHEDWEYSVRVHQAGLVLWYEAAATVYHESSHSHDVRDAYYVYNDLLSRMLFEKRVLPRWSFALWCGLYRLYLELVLPLLWRLRPGRYLGGFAREDLRSCMRAALRDVEWIDRTTPALLARFRRRFKGGAAGELRIAHVPATSGLTGVEAHLLVLFEGLRALGVDSYLVCVEDGPLTEDLRARGFEVRLAAPRGRFGGLALFKLARALDGADLVHLHAPRSFYWSMILQAFGATPPTVGTVHQFNVSGLSSPWKRALFGWLERVTIRRLREVLVVSRLLREQVIAATGLSPDRAHWVPNSAAVLLTPPRPFTPPNDPPRMVILARLSPEKSIATALAAWADPRLRAHALTLRIAGDGPDRAALEAQAQALGIANRVEFLGWRRDALALVEGALALLSPSRSETFGIAALEAMTLGVPVIATYVSGHRDLLGDDFREWMVPAEDAPALADAIVRLLALDPAARRALGARLAERARSTFGPERSASRTREVYEVALGRRARAAEPA